MMSSPLSLGVRLGICGLRVGTMVLHVQGELVPASLGVKVTWKPIGDASAPSPLMVKGIGWGQDDIGMILGPTWVLWPPSSFAPTWGLLELAQFLIWHLMSQGAGPVLTMPVPGELLPSPQQVNSEAPRALRPISLPMCPAPSTWPLSTNPLPFLLALFNICKVHSHLCSLISFVSPRDPR